MLMRTAFLGCRTASSVRSVQEVQSLTSFSAGSHAAGGLAGGQERVAEVQHLYW